MRTVTKQLLDRLQHIHDQPLRLTPAKDPWQSDAIHLQGTWVLMVDGPDDAPEAGDGIDIDAPHVILGDESCDEFEQFWVIRNSTELDRVIQRARALLPQPGMPDDGAHSTLMTPVEADKAGLCMPAIKGA